jgi:GT2 family glycosyltransferase
MLKIAVVILNWNGEALLEQYLPSVMEYSEGATVYLADNASSDGSVAYVKKNIPG